MTTLAQALIRAAGGALVIALAGLGAQPARAEFNEKEKGAILDFWAHKAQYTAEPDGQPGAEWCVRLTPTGSKWIREVYRQFQATKVVPTQDPKGFTPEQQDWIAWIDRQVQRDWAEAEQKAQALNQGATVPRATKVVVPEPIHFDRKAGTDKVGRLQPAPAPLADDPCPNALVALVGPAPRFAAPVRPLRHTIVFPDGTSLVYRDNVKVRPKYAYYRFADGVNSEGQSVKSLPSNEIDALFKSAGMTNTERNVMRTVSMHEGGFDAVNTYDTGYVSVGFIQFACLADGTGSLGEMMAHYKATKPKAFDEDFRKYGIDVEGNKLDVLDLESGDEKTGPEAATQIIHDKRLVAVFQRAGLVSTNFRVAQLQAAKKQFYPADDKVAVCLCGNTCQIRVGDVFQSEAGLATLMDRKINTGKIGGLKETLEKLAVQYDIKDPSDLTDIEFLATRAMAWRTDYTLSAWLSRPRDNTADLSRRGSRLDRSSKNQDPASGGGSRKGTRIPKKS